jgi:hypothetical protein
MGEGLFENSPKTVSFLAKKEKKILFFLSPGKLLEFLIVQNFLLSLLENFFNPFPPFF